MKTNRIGMQVWISCISFALSSTRIFGGTTQRVAVRVRNVFIAR